MEEHKEKIERMMASKRILWARILDTIGLLHFRFFRIPGSFAWVDIRVLARKMRAHLEKRAAMIILCSHMIEEAKKLAARSSQWVPSGSSAFLLFVFLMVECKHLFMCFFIDHWFFYWCTSSEFSGLHDNFSFLILSELLPEVLASLKLFADAPQSSLGWVEVIGKLHAYFLIEFFFVL